MSIEVELKAYVADPIAIRKKLTFHLGASVPLVRTDQYYKRKEDKLDLIRVRTEEDRIIVNSKKRKINNGIEENQEYEFDIDNPQEFSRFLSILEFYPSYTKEKKVEIFSSSNLTYELTQIEGLGWFIEIETILNSEDNIEEGRQRVLRALLELGFSEKHIEPRSYKLLLQRANRI